jgi:flagellar protein FlbD
MILLTKLSGQVVMINETLIETAQETPDTVITMNNGHSYIVSEKLDEIMDKVIEFNRRSKRRSTRDND